MWACGLTFGFGVVVGFVGLVVGVILTLAVAYLVTTESPDAPMRWRIERE